MYRARYLLLYIDSWFSLLQSFCYKIPKYHAQSRLGMLLQNINKLEKGDKTNKLQYLRNIYIFLRMKFKYIH